MSNMSYDLARAQQGALLDEAEKSRRASRAAAAYRLQRRAARLSQKAARVNRKAEQVATRARLAVARAL